MRAIKALGNNAAVCVDAKGSQLIALGRGVGFGELPKEVSLKDIRRTFYDVDSKYLALISELDPQQIEFSAQFADIVRTQLSSELSPNLPVILADHISFAIKRAREHMVVTMPVAYDVQQQYPTEYRLSQMAVNGIDKTFKVHLPRSEAVGITLCIVNCIVESSTQTALNEKCAEHLLETAVEYIEDTMKIKVDRDGFDYARFATHLRYLMQRIKEKAPLNTPNQGLYTTLVEQFPLATACAESIASSLAKEFGQSLTEEEKVYLILHVNRIAARYGIIEGPQDAI
jgi:beta-glucoside operon transcriptional antiterminator